LPNQRGKVTVQDKGFAEKVARLVTGSRESARKLLKGRELLKGGDRNRTDDKGFADLI